ncbi:jg22880 [Pararge aegeria aegeria]|uniref:Jg22880 protein n=1 Tax=Pararge aegeria aegeria TaxID=348720 RepID=A0A8S4RX21_9NEOP|nr:jg22880 [Pararge aegeria aegeria]
MKRRYRVSARAARYGALWRGMALYGAGSGHDLVTMSGSLERDSAKNLKNKFNNILYATSYRNAWRPKPLTRPDQSNSETINSQVAPSRDRNQYLLLNNNSNYHSALHCARECRNRESFYLDKSRGHAARFSEGDYGAWSGVGDATYDTARPARLGPAPSASIVSRHSPATDSFYTIAVF